MTSFFINGKFLNQPLTGVQRYAYELSRRIVEYNEAQVITPSRASYDTRYSLATGTLAIGGKGNVLWEQCWLPAYLSQKGKPLLLNLCNVAPVFYRNKITCIHDLAFARFPHFFSPAFYRFYKTIIPRIIQSSRHLVTVSEFSKQELMEYYKVPASKISVIYNGVTPLNPSAAPGSAPFTKPYYLFVGSMDPRKNLLFLLQCFIQAQLKDMMLVVVGAGARSFNTSLQHQLAPFLHHSNIHFAGKITDQELAACYRHAQALVVPSLYEGFGLPIIEALAIGCPVYAADIPVFHEIGKNNLSYFNPYKEEELVALLKQPKPATPEKASAVNTAFDWDIQAQKLSRLALEYCP